MLRHMLLGLGKLDSKLGQYSQAQAKFTEAKALYKLEEHTLGEANVLLALGRLGRRLGQHDDARSTFTAAAYLYGELGMEQQQRAAELEASRR